MVEISAARAVKFGLLKSDCCIFRDVPMTVAPASRKVCVTLVPKPPLAPVTSTTLPFIDCSHLTGHQIPTGLKGYETRLKTNAGCPPHAGLYEQLLWQASEGEMGVNINNQRKVDGRPSVR